MQGQRKVQLDYISQSDAILFISIVILVGNTVTLIILIGPALLVVVKAMTR